MPSAELSARLSRVRPSLLLAAGLLAVSVALHLRDPHQQGSWGFCPWNLLTGMYCPGCGGLRAVNDLTRGQVYDAASSNLLAVLGAPVLAMAWGRTVVQRWHGVRRRPLPPAVVGTASALALCGMAAFTVLRNLPAGGWLAP